MKWLTLFDDGGTGPPPGWSNAAGSPTWTRGSAAGTPGDGNAYLVESNASGSSLRKMHWTERGTAVDQEVVAAALATSTSTSNEFGGISVRSLGANTYYYASLSRFNGVSEVLVAREFNGNWSEIGVILLTWSINQWVCIRLRVVGSRIQVKAWIPSDSANPGGNEPTGWQLDQQDTTITAAGHAAVQYWHSSGGRWAFLGYATGGDTAPMLLSDLEPDPDPETPTNLSVVEEAGSLRSSWSSPESEFILQRERWVGPGDPP